MKDRNSRIILLAILVVAITGAIGFAANTPPGADPAVDPMGEAGALREKVETGCGYSPHSGNASRSIMDLDVPGAVGEGLDFTRHWNSIYMGEGPTGLPTPLGSGGWSHSWRWKAVTSEMDYEHTPENGPPPYATIYFTYIKINYPDGRIGVFHIQRNSQNWANNPSGPPYEAGDGEDDWTPHIAHQDRLKGMTRDGVSFWLCLSDGSAVHFQSLDPPYREMPRYRADKVVDAHGLVTRLEYDDTRRYVAYPNTELYRLSRVVEPAGRSLTFSWQYLSGLPAAVIYRVTASNGQYVQYGYTSYTVSGITRAALTKVIYAGDLDPVTGQTVAATYSYTTHASGGAAPFYNGPVLTYADDPRFAGPMTRIRYTFWGGPGGSPMCTYAGAWGPAPGAYANSYKPGPFAVETESSGATGRMVSQLWMPCVVDNNAPGHSDDNSKQGWRIETRGTGEKRTFYFGTSGGSEPGSSWYNYNGGHWDPPEAGLYRNYGHDLTRVTDFTNNAATSEYQHMQWGHPWRLFDGKGTLTELDWEPDTGHVTQIWRRGSDNSTLKYNWTDPGSSAAQNTTLLPNTLPHWLFSQTDERNLTTTYTRDSLRRVTRITYPGSSESFTYNAFNQILVHTLPSGGTKHYEYDGRGRLTKEWNSADGDQAGTIYTYDAYDRVSTAQNARARASGKAYSARMEYNARHQITKVHYPSTGAGADPTVIYEYDKYGNCIAITNELNQRSTYTYDEYRRCTRYSEPLYTSNWNGTSTIAYRTWDWWYDRGGLTGGIPASAHTSKQWRFQLEPAFNAAGDRRGIARDFDANDRVTIEQRGWVYSAAGNWSLSADVQTQYFSYDVNGNKKTYTDPRGRLTTYEHDKRDRLTKTTEPLNYITTTAYDVAGNKTSVTFPDGKLQRWYTYDAFGQPGLFLDERGDSTNFSYVWGPMKKLRTVTTHRTKDSGAIEDQVTLFWSDVIGRPVAITFPDGSTEVTTYQYGQPRTWKPRRGTGATKTMNYDARGRETSHTWSGGTAAGVSRAWDDANRLKSLANLYSTIDYGYDSAGQVRYEGNNIAGSSGRRVTTYYRYPSGEVAHITYPNAFKFRRDYTARGQLQTIGTDNASGAWLYKLAQYTYLADGNVYQETDYNGVATGYAYDGRGKIGVTHTLRLSPSQRYSYRTYYRDKRDRIGAWTKSNSPAFNPLENGRGDRYVYDAEGQLYWAWYQALSANTSNVNSPQRKEYLYYDELGNRKGDNYLGSPRSWVRFARKDNGLNQYGSWSPYGITYETSGVLTKDGIISASINALNQPIAIRSSAVAPAGSSVWFGYDPLGRCVKRWIGSDTQGAAATNPAKYFYYDGWDLIQEGSSTVTERIYLHGNGVDHIVADLSYVAPVQWRFHHYDARGHCILLTDQSGYLVEQYDYDAFGEPYFYNGQGVQLLNSSGAPRGESAFGNRFLFTGREWLSNLKLYDYRNRHYLPEMGRFLQPDPKHFAAGDYNLYRYCHNDPINKTDPTGEIVPVLIGIWAAYEIGSTIYDAYTAAETFSNPEASTTDKVLAGGGLLASAALPGGGYGTAARGIKGTASATKAPALKPGQKVGGSGKAVSPTVKHPSRKEAHDAAQAETAKGKSPIHDKAKPEKGTPPHYHGADSEGKRKATHHDYKK